MAMLADLVELVIGVDTHKDTHTAAVVIAATGAVVEQATVPATPAGYRQLLQLAARQPGQRVGAVEGTGGYGAGLTRFLAAHQEQVVELDRPKRAARRQAPRPIPWTPSGRPARPWAATGSPSPAPPASARHCRCGSPRAARRFRLPLTPSGSCRRWWSRLPTSSAAGCVA
jgi:transposase